LTGLAETSDEGFGYYLYKGPYDKPAVVEGVTPDEVWQFSHPKNQVKIWNIECLFDYKTGMRDHSVRVWVTNGVIATKSQCDGLIPAALYFHNSSAGANERLHTCECVQGPERSVVAELAALRRLIKDRGYRY
jgi:hypothetical protein